MTDKNYTEIVEQLTDGINTDTFRRLVNKLLNVNFIVRSHPKQGERADYDFIRRNSEAFSAVFQHLLGFNLTIDEVNGVIFIQDIEGLNKVSFVQDESIVTLLFCLLYQENIKDVSLARGVFVTPEDIKERYFNLKGKTLTSGRLYDICRKLRRYNLIWCDKDAARNDLAQIQIFPSILFVLRKEGLDEEYEAQSSLELYKGDIEDDSIDEE